MPVTGESRRSPSCCVGLIRGRVGRGHRPEGAAHRRGRHAGRRPRRARGRRAAHATRRGFAMRATGTGAIRSRSPATGSASVGAASGKVLVLALVEGRSRDTAVRPAIRYRRTTAAAGRARSGSRPRAQLFRVREHTATPPAADRAAPSHTADAPPSPADADGDGDGRRAGLRTARQGDSSRAADLPDLGVRRLELRRHRRHREGRDLRLAERQGRGSGHQGETEARDPRGSRRRGRQRSVCGSGRGVVRARHRGDRYRSLRRIRPGHLGAEGESRHRDRRLSRRRCWRTAPGTSRYSCSASVVPRMARAPTASVRSRIRIYASNASP